MPYISGSQRYVRTADQPVSDARRTSPEPARAVAVADRTEKSRPPEVRERVRRMDNGEVDRRRVNQRILRKPVLFDSRSGVDRRQRNQREGDIAEHISVLV